MSGRFRVIGHYRGCWALLIFSFLLPSILPGQNPSEPGMVFKKTVRLVEIDVIARDKHGNLVQDLEAKDFTLLDNGRVQKIGRFSIAQGPPAALPATPAVATKVLPVKTPTFSNTHPENAVATVILFDLLNTPAELQPAMKKQLLKALANLKPGTPIALLILGDHLSVVSDFTTSTISLADTAGSAFSVRPEGFGPPITARATGNPIRDALISKAVSKAFRADEDERVQRTLAALNVIGEQLGRMKGRKSLLWLTGGLAVTGQLSVVESAVEKLNDADVAVYTFDARGAILDAEISAENDSNDLTSGAMQAREDVRGDVLGVMAEGTGGIFYHNRNELDGAIEQAIEDSSLVYILNYYPEQEDSSGKFHRLVVKTSRPGVRLRYRSGYLASPPAQPALQDQQRMLTAIANSPLEFDGIHFSVEINAAHEPGSARLLLHFPADELQWSPQMQQTVSAVQVWYIQRRASGEDLITTASKGDWRLPTDSYQEATRQGVAFASDLKLNAGAAKVRVLVRDTNSGKMGTVDVMLDSIKLSPAH
ncbi:MAG: VWA domain-containing protein [Terriglobales bacterium]